MVKKLGFNILLRVKNHIDPRLMTLKFSGVVYLCGYLFQFIKIDLILHQWNNNKANGFKTWNDNLINSLFNVLRFTICNQDANLVEQLVIYLLVVNKLDDLPEVSRTWEVEELQLLLVGGDGGGIAWWGYHKLYTMLWKLFLVKLAVHRV